MTNLMETIKRGVQISLVVPLSALVIGGCSTREITNIPYRGYHERDQGGSGKSYDLVFDWQKIDDRGSRDPELTLNGDPKMETVDKDTLEMGRRYNVTYRTYWVGQDKIIKVEKADSI